MSQAELAALERDVEQARARFASDLARLSAPGTVSSFKNQLVSEVQETKDEWVERSTQAAKDGAQRVFNDLKERAMANPAAALAIGAGLAWRLARHPPIASVLIGMGLVGLFRTSPQASESYMGLHDENGAIGRYRRQGIGSRASGYAEAMKDRVQEWSADAGDATRDTMSQIKEKAATMADRASEAARETASQVAEKTAVMADKAAMMANRASSAVHNALPDRETRDKLLLGTAALAVAAAVGIAAQRRNQETGQY